MTALLYPLYKLQRKLRHNRVDFWNSCSSYLIERHKSQNFYSQGDTKMTNFVIVYTGGGMPESEAEQAAVMGAWGAWYEGMGEAIVDGGNPFGAAKSIGGDGQVHDGPISSPPATGYTIVAANSLDAAMAKVKNHPHLQYGGQISVYETFQM
jgi:hypothetical protein